MSSSREGGDGLALLRRVFTPSPQPVILTTCEGAVLWVNRAAAPAAGAAVGQALGQVVLNRQGSLDRTLSVVGRTSHPVIVRLKFIGAEGVWHVWRVDVAAGEAPVLVFQADSRELLVARFLSLKREAENARRLRQEATHLASLMRTDRLTGLLNAEGFEACTRRVLGSPQPKGVFLFLDLDGFKAVNDTFGHDAGDTVLKAIAGRYREATRDRDCIARLGGDEFAFWLDGLSETDLPAALERLEELTGAPIGWRDPLNEERAVLRVAASLGAALAPRDGSSYEVLKALSDQRMYESKRKKSRRARA